MPFYSREGTHPVSETSNGGLSTSMKGHGVRHGGKNGKPLTSARVRVRFVKFEGHPLDEVAQVVCTSHNIRVWCGGRASDSDRPSVSVFRRGIGALFLV